MRICSWKDGGSENESNQVVILAINSRLRNRCCSGDFARGVLWSTPGSSLQVVGALHFPDSIELYEVGLNRNVGEVLRKKIPSAEEFAAVMVGFRCFVTLEMSKTAIGGAVGVAHDQDSLRLVQADRHANLFEDEVLLEIIAWRSQSLGASGNDDHVSALNALLLQKFSHRRADAMIEAAENSGVGYVWGGGRVEMEDF